MARNSYFNENTLEELLEEIKYVYQSDKRPWVIGYSGGKDSTTVVELVYKMLQMLPKEERNKNVYIVSSDTLIENPLIKIYLSKMNKLLGEAAKKDDLPIISTMVTPPADNSFWANVIGRGFPTPRINGTFRWCTDRLKINPSANYIRNVIKKEGEEVVVLLGVRKAESEARRRRIEGRELANRLMNRHETIQDAYVYNPIVELTTEDVWDVLLRLDGGKTPWGSNNNELVSLYAGADSGECPFAGVHAGGQTQSCGNSRLEHFIINDSGKIVFTSFFEQLVVELLLEMGYGSDELSGRVLGKAHDGGIDGVDNEERRQEVHDVLHRNTQSLPNGLRNADIVWMNI